MRWKGKKRVYKLQYNIDVTNAHIIRQTTIHIYSPIDNHTGGSSSFMMINDKNHSLMENTAQLLIGHQNTSWLYMK